MTLCLKFQVFCARTPRKQSNVSYKKNSKKHGT